MGSSITKLLGSALLAAASLMPAAPHAYAEGEAAPAAIKYSIAMEMAQARKPQMHIVPFTADQGKLTIKQELVTDGNMAAVYVDDADDGTIVGGATLSGYDQTEIELPKDGNYLFYFYNFEGNWIDTEKQFGFSLEGPGLHIADTTLPKLELPEFTPYEEWSEPLELIIRSDTNHVAITLDDEPAGSFEADADADGMIPLGIDPAELDDGFHQIIFETENEHGNSTVLFRSFMVDRIDAFSDVPKSHWAHRPVEIMNTLGIVDGMADGVFAPSRSVTREQFAKMLAGSLQLPEPTDEESSESRFADITPSAWSAPYVEALAAAGLVEGEADGNGVLYFRPDRPISRAEAAAMMARTGEVPEVADGAAAKSFPDVGSLPAWARDSIQLLNQAGWIDGYEDGLFHPGGTLTRAEAAKLLGKFRNI